jgi:CheY-like chemotaxis protein
MGATGKTGTMLQSIVVVLVEDDPDALVLLRVMMEHEGALVFPTSDAKSALETLERVRPQVLVSDMSMPEHDGGWLVAEARSKGLLHSTRTVVVTALPMTQQRVADAGFDAYLRKPVDPHTLCMTVRALAQAE